MHAQIHRSPFKFPSAKPSLLLTEQFDRLWSDPKNRDELRRTYGTVPKIKKVMKSFANKLRNNGEKEENAY